MTWDRNRAFHVVARGQLPLQPFTSPSSRYANAATQRAVLLYLVSESTDDGLVNASIANIAAATSMCESTVRRGVRALSATGFLVFTGCELGRVPTYRIVLEPAATTDQSTAAA